MTNEEQIIYNLIEERVNKAIDILRQMPKCRHFYVSLAASGYEEQAEGLRSIMIYNAMLHPDWRDKEHLQFIYDKFVQRAQTI